MRIIAAASAVLLLVACGGDPSPSATTPEPPTAAHDDATHGGHDDGAPLPETDSAEGQRLVTEDGALLLDVRTAEEYEAKHIAGAKRVGVADISERVAEIAEMAGGKDKPIVVYCGAGRRAARAQAALEDAGFSAVTNLGGVNDWSCEEGKTCHKGSKVDAQPSDPTE